LGARGWPDLRRVLPQLVRETKVVTRDPEMRDACISDLLVTCDQTKSFSLLNAPPFYHTDHDTLDKISRSGMDRAVEFHMRVLQAIGAWQT
jgi:hypothetical protein